MSLLASLCLTVPVPALPQDPAAAPTAATAGFTVDLSHRGQRQWKVQLPAEEWRPVGTSFPFASSLGHDFKTELEGTRLKVDTDGDGSTDVTVEGTKAFLTLRGKSPAGKPIQYAVRLKNEQGWKFAPGGFLRGKIKGQQVRLIDQNNNGVFGEPGEDAMVVGHGSVATYFSAAVDVRGTLYSIAVTPDGTSLECAPYAGPVGKLHLSCTTKGKVLAAVVRSADRQFSFDMAKAADGLAVPVGDYSLMTGELGLGASRVTMTTGKSKPIAVAADETKEVCWGGPVRAEFDYKRAGGQVHLTPEQVWLYGATGELYTGWVPLGASPKFTILDGKTGKEVAQAHFPGTC